MKKVAILTTSLSNGGAERFVLNLYQLLTYLNYNVVIISVNDIVEFDIDGVKYKTLETNWTTRFAFLKPILLRKYLKNIGVNVLIDNRSVSNPFKFFVYHFFLKNFTKIKMVHSYNIYNYFFKNAYLNSFFLNKNTKIVCVSDQIKERCAEDLELQNLTRIYNAVPKFDKIIMPDIKDDYILYFGRLDNKVKDLFFLINAYNQSILPSNNIKLIILGSGPDKCDILDLIKKLNLQDFVTIIPSINSPYGYVKKALFSVITSNYEGFPMSVVESLALGTPVVSVNFKSGISELIVNEYNGLICEKKMELYSDCLNKMILNKKLYLDCKNNTVKSVEHLNVKLIAQQWKLLIQSS